MARQGSVLGQEPDIIDDFNALSRRVAEVERLVNDRFTYVPVVTDPPAGTPSVAILWGRLSAGKMQLAVRMPDGTDINVATQP